MLVLNLLLLFLTYKYGRQLKDKLNAEYERRFNFKLISKENSKKPFIASILIIFGSLYFGISTTDRISGIVFILAGIGIVLHEVYAIYKKTNLEFGLIAALIYFIILIIYLSLGLGVIFLFLLFVAMSYQVVDENNRHRPLF